MIKVWRIGRALVLAAALISITIAPSLGQQGALSDPMSAGMVTVVSAHSVVETERRFVEALASAGIKVAAQIDHRANAVGAGLDLPPTLLLIFGNPRAGTPLMERQRTIGLDLPLKVLIWEEAGQTRLTYIDPDHLARRHGIGETLPVIGQIKAALDNFASVATKP